MTSERLDRTTVIQGWVERLQSGDESPRVELIRIASDRLLRLTRKIGGGFQRSVGRWEQTDDVFQRATTRLYQSLEDVEIRDASHFFNLAALQIRRELVDLARHYQGPEGIGANQLTQGALANPREDEQEGNNAALEPEEITNDPRIMQEWAEFHEVVEGLPTRLREVVDLLWYHGMTQEEAARVLNTSARNVRRVWREARLSLHEKISARLLRE